ncbi:hypothetical protein SBA4_2700002 [Candidatus Sulfopaludibacter sp. SbA4]|nr:hypothetical protein SBA4_2700002 [Candidatus Sulfopaludibacter sp. SbA4]
MLLAQVRRKPCPQHTSPPVHTVLPQHVTSVPLTQFVPQHVSEALHAPLPQHFTPLRQVARKPKKPKKPPPEQHTCPVGHAGPLPQPP